MKKFLLSLLVVAASTMSFAQATAKVESAAKIEFDKQTHDYGNVDYDSDGTSVFTFTNTGNAPLVISKAKGSCGCTVPEWPEGPIAPGATGEIKVRYDTKRAGGIARSVTIFSNAMNEPSKILRIKGTVGANPAVKEAKPVK